MQRRFPLALVGEHLAPLTRRHALIEFFATVRILYILCILYFLFTTDDSVICCRCRSFCEARNGERALFVLAAAIKFPLVDFDASDCSARPGDLFPSPGPSLSPCPASALILVVQR